MTINEQYQEMRTEINESKDQYLTDLFILISHLEKNKWFEGNQQVLDKIYDSLEKTYAITSSHLRRIYNLSTRKIEDVNDLAWSEDNKTLEKRVHDYFVQYEQEALEQAIRSLKYAITRILDTETAHLYNTLIYNTVKDKAIEAEVFGEYDDCHGECDYWITKGRMPIEELTELPPYHPDCECYVVYYI